MLVDRLPRAELGIHRIQGMQERRHGRHAERHTHRGHDKARRYGQRAAEQDDKHHGVQPADKLHRTGGHAALLHGRQDRPHARHRMRQQGKHAALRIGGLQHLLLPPHHRRDAHRTRHRLHRDK